MNGFPKTIFSDVSASAISQCIAFSGDAPVLDDRNIDFGGGSVFRPLSFLRVPNPYSGGVVVSIVIPVDLSTSSFVDSSGGGRDC